MKANMTNNTSKLLVALFCISASTLSFAGGFGSLLKKDEGEKSSADPHAMQEQVVQQYITASTHVNGAQILMAEAFGLSDQAAMLAAEQEALKNGSVSDQDSLERNKEVTENANAAILEKIEAGEMLDASGKDKFQGGIVLFFSGLYETKKVIDEGGKFVESSKGAIGSASFMDKAKLVQKLSAGTYIMKEIPGHAKSLFDSSKMMMTYANDNDIDIPDDATSEISF